MKHAYLIIILFFGAAFSAISAMNPKKTEAHRLQQTADSLFYLEQYPKALEYFIKGLEAAEKLGDDITYMNCTGYISNIYDAFGDYKSAVSYLLKGYDMASKHKLDDMQANFLINIVMTYCRLGDVVNAKKYYEQSKQKPLSFNHSYWEYYILYNKANILKAENRYQEAIAAHKEALDYAKSHDFNGHVKRKQMFVLYQESEIGNLYVKIGDSNMAKKYGYECITLSREAKSNELLSNAYKMLADAFRQEEEADSTDKYMSLYVAVSDSVYDTKSFYIAQGKLSEYEDKVRREHIRSLWIINAIVLAVLLLVGILAFLVILNNRRLRTAQRLLVDKNEELEKHDHERQMLLDRYLNGNLTKNADFIENFQEEKTKEEGGAMSQIQKDKLLKQIIEILNNIDNISNPDFNLNMLADLAQSNTKYVSMVINETYGKNFKTLLNEYRCREASHLLLDNETYGNYTMQAIYETVGYTNAATFIRAFKAMYGMTPSTYKKL